MPQGNGNASAKFLRKTAREARRKQHKAFVAFFEKSLPRYCEERAARGKKNALWGAHFSGFLKVFLDENELLPKDVDIHIVKAALLEVLESKMPGVRLVGNKIEKQDLVRFKHYSRNYGNYDGFKFVLTWEKDEPKEAPVVSKEDSKENSDDHLDDGLNSPSQSQ